MPMLVPMFVTAFWAGVFVGGPLLVPLGRNKELATLMIKMTAVSCWCLWLMTIMNFAHVWQRKNSAFCIVISTCGLIFLGVLGFFFYIEATTLFSDLHFQDEDIVTVPDIKANYHEQAKKCWIAAGLWGLTLVVALFRFNM